MKLQIERDMGRAPDRNRHNTRRSNTGQQLSDLWPLHLSRLKDVLWLAKEAS